MGHRPTVKRYDGFFTLEERFSDFDIGSQMITSHLVIFTYLVSVADFDTDGYINRYRAHLAGWIYATG